MKLTLNEKQVVLSVLDDVIDHMEKETGYPYPGGVAYNTDNDLLFSFDTEDYKALKRALIKIKGGG